jgi:hypothetical protein
LQVNHVFHDPVDVGTLSALVLALFPWIFCLKVGSSVFIAENVPPKWATYKEGLMVESFE